MTSNVNIAASPSARPRKRRWLRISVVLVVLVAGVFGFTVPAFASDPAVWIGSPVNGTWPNTNGCAGAIYPSASCSLPTVHHIVYYNPVGGYLDDWAADLQSVPVGRRVMLYAAPQNTGLNISARVETVGAACRSGWGGYNVGVAFYHGSTRIGTANYAHINPTVHRGQLVNRWGTQLGTVGGYAWSSCWQGSHVHVELSSQHHYACFNRAFVNIPGRSIRETNFIGFIGGNYAGGRRQACP